MRDLDAMLMFAGVAARGSFTAAARALGIPKATLSRRVRQLEASLGVRLVQRSSRRIALTEAGRTFYEHCEEIAAATERAERAIQSLTGEPSGVLRISAPFTVAHLLIAPILPPFLLKYPRVRVLLTLHNDSDDLIRTDSDIVVATAPHDVTQASRLLVRAPTALHASADYVRTHGMPATPADLAQHALLAYARPASTTRPVWRLQSKGREVAVPIGPAVTANDFGPLYEVMLGGLGVVLAPEPYAAADVELGKVVRVLPDWTGPDLELRAVFGSPRGLLPKTRAFVDDLVAVCRDLPGWTSPDRTKAAAMARVAPIGDRAM